MSEPGLLQRAAVLHAAARKDDDYLWARITGRWPAALLLAALHRLPLTPNGLSLVSLGIGWLACAAFAWWPGAVGLWVGFATGQIAYVVDCMDGMHARAAGLRSRAGVALDFLADAIKQAFLFPALAWRLWDEAGRPVDGPGARWLWLAILAGPLVAAALMLTTFLRSPEVTGQPQRVLRGAHDRSPRGRVAALGALLLNYPSWILLPVLLDRMDLFLVVSLTLYAAHAAASLLCVARTLCTREHYRGP